MTIVQNFTNSLEQLKFLLNINQQQQQQQQQLQQVPLGDNWNSPYSLTVQIICWIVAGLLSLETIIGNAMVIVAYKIERSISKQIGNRFIVSLAISDMIIGLEGIPLFTVYVINGDRWPLGSIACETWLFLDYTLCLVSILTVLLITADRYLSVCHTAKYLKWQSPMRIQILIVISWIFPTFVFGLMIYGWPLISRLAGENSNDSKISKGECYAPFLSNPYVNMSMYVAYYWTTLVAMLILYTGIHKAAKKLEKKAEAKEHRHIALLLTQRLGTQVGVSLMLHSQKQQQELKRSNEKINNNNNKDSGYNTNTLSINFDNTKEIGENNNNYTTRRCSAFLPPILAIVEQKNDLKKKKSRRHSHSIERIANENQSLKKSIENGAKNKHHSKIDLLKLDENFNENNSLTTTSNNPTQHKKYRNSFKYRQQQQQQHYNAKNNKKKSSLNNDSTTTTTKADTLDFMKLSKKKKILLLEENEQQQQIKNKQSIILNEIPFIEESAKLTTSSTTTPTTTPTTTINPETTTIKTTINPETTTINSETTIKTTTTTTIKKSSTMLSPTNFDNEIIKERLRQRSWIFEVSRRVSKWVNGPTTSFETTNTSNEFLKNFSPQQQQHRISRSFSMSSSISSSMVSQQNIVYQLNSNRLNKKTSLNEIDIQEEEVTINNEEIENHPNLLLKQNDEQKNSLLLLKNPNNNNNNNKNHNISSNIQSYFTPTNVLNRIRKRTKAEKRAHKAFRTITFIVGLFAILWSPYYVVATIYGFCKGECIPAIIYNLSYYMCYLNSSGNPFAYATANRQFRHAFIRMFRGNFNRVS